MEKYDEGKCNCEFCTNYRRYKWAIIKECPCGCHTSDDITGHDGLCCEFPNGKQKDIPYEHLESSSFYKKIINSIENE